MAKTYRSELQINLDTLKRFSWQQRSFESEVDFKLFEFYFPLVYPTPSRSEILFKEAIRPDSPSLYIILGALRAIIQCRSAEKEGPRPNLKVYVFALNSPANLPDCMAYKKNKWHIVESYLMNPEEKYSYFETDNLLIVFRHKWKDSDSCFLFIYRKKDDD